MKSKRYKDLRTGGKMRSGKRNTRHKTYVSWPNFSLSLRVVSNVNYIKCLLNVQRWYGNFLFLILDTFNTIDKSSKIQNQIPCKYKVLGPVFTRLEVVKRRKAEGIIRSHINLWQLPEMWIGCHIWYNV